MKIYLFLIGLFFLNNLLFAVENRQLKNIAHRFLNFYNNKNYKEIYKLFNSQMTKSLPLEKTENFLAGLFAQAGDISSLKFLRQQNPYAVYKAKFTRGVFLLSISVDKKGKMNGLFIKPFLNKKLPVLKRNKSKLILPFNGEWNVFWGGMKLEQNYHISTPSQKGAFDFVIFDKEGKSFAKNAGKNTEYYIFGKEVISPVSGEIVLVVRGVKDNKPGELNPFYVPGNTVILKTKANEFLLFAHFKQFSIKVKQGDMVKRGQLLGLVGNTGNSSEPHLHFHIQNVEEMVKASGARCFFDKILVNGKLKRNYSPVKGERVKNP